LRSDSHKNSFQNHNEFVVPDKRIRQRKLSHTEVTVEVLSKFLQDMSLLNPINKTKCHKMNKFSTRQRMVLPEEPEAIES